jgi:tetratricopeptide (TPR) repeat protein
MDSNKLETIEKAKDLRAADELEDSQELLLSLLDSYPDDPVVLFEVGGSYDVMGYEEDAIPFYNQAIDAGLEGPELLECLICLGISQRAIGDIQEAVDVLESARDQFPEDSAIKAFLALAYYSDDRFEDAFQLLLELLLATTKDEQLLAYSDTLDYYRENLDEVWED